MSQQPVHVTSAGLAVVRKRIIAKESEKADFLASLTASVPAGTSPAVLGDATSGSPRELPGAFPIGLDAIGVLSYS